MQKHDKDGQQGQRQQSQQNDRRPQQDRDLQRNKQSDRGGQAGGSEPSEGRQPSQQNVHGEGNYAASRQYNDATREFAQSGRVDEAARNAAPRSDAEAKDMQAAEAEGKRHAKGEDPALGRKRSELAPDASRAPKPGEEE
ncbi:MAG TPA: hypothetical protein VFI50_11895 [Casimicrobiaceae bacterium]|nr:hypothetical protein [Casimicrobiaceae bacterium]